MSKHFALSVILGACATFAAINQSAAHHGWAGQGRDQFELSGTVYTAVSFGGPHATMQIEDDMGQVWDITLAPPTRTARAGLQEDTIPVGAAVTVSGHRNSSSGKFEIKTERVTHNGVNYDVYPNRL